MVQSANHHFIAVGLKGGHDSRLIQMAVLWDGLVKLIVYDILKVNVGIEIIEVHASPFKV